MYNNIPTTTIDAPEEDYLYVDPSQIEGAGNGLYTAITIYKGEVISIFKGEFINAIEQNRRIALGENQYFITLLTGRVMDSKHIDCFAKYANDVNGNSKSEFKNNSFITLNENDEPCIVASKTIKSGSEIFCDYGKNYWK